MKEIAFGYGKGKEKVDIDEKNLIAALMPRKEGEVPCYEQVLKKAMAAPIGRAPLSTLVKTGQRVAVIISDVTRPCPSGKILPIVLRELYAGGVKKEDITIVSGLGSHREQTQEEWEHLVGAEILHTVKTEDSTAYDFVLVGTSTKGTPFEVARTVAEADIRVCIGNIDYHYFAGYSGGAKAVVPGVCTPATIEKNHAMMLKDGAKVGHIAGNPVRKDMEEILHFLSIDFILNVVLNAKKEIVGAVAGDAIKAHREGCKLLDAIYKQPIRELADIVITSPGGLPKDLNVYQSQKALDNAQWAVKEGGIIILVAECGEGYGSAVFGEWLEEADCPQDLIDRVERQFRLGGHKAAAIAKVTEKAEVYLVSALPEEQVAKLYMKCFRDLPSAYAAALKAKGEDARVYAIPIGGTTLPVWEEK